MASSVPGSINGEITYRPYNAATDQNSAKAIIRTYLGEGYDMGVVRFASTTLVAESGGRLVGVLVYKLFAIEVGYEPMAELASIAVLPDWRKRGVAAELEKRFAAQVPERRLLASGVPVAAQSFYSKRGYIRVGSSSRWEKAPRGRTLQQIGQQRSASSLSRSRRRRAAQA